MNDRIKIVIIDFNNDLLQNLNNIIKLRQNNYDIVGAARDSLDGLKIILQKNPDVVFIYSEKLSDCCEKFSQIIDYLKISLIVISDTTNHECLKNESVTFILKNNFKNQALNVLDKIQNNIIINNYNFNSTANLEAPKKIILPTNSGYYFIDISNIIRLEADGSYTKMYLLDNKFYLISRTLKDLEVFFNKSIFVRTHRSHIININHIVKYNKSINKLNMIDKSNIPISRSNQFQFNAILENSFIKLNSVTA